MGITCKTYFIYGVNNFMWSPRMNQDSTMEPPEEPIDNNDDSANDLIDR